MNCPKCGAQCFVPIPFCGKRQFNIKSSTGQSVTPKTPWTKTILDVRAENDMVYCADAREWARSALAEAPTVSDTIESRGDYGTNYC